jgi:hypothetical protein
MPTGGRDREDNQWLADVPELPGAHTYARSLPSLEQAIREVVVLAAGRRRIRSPVIGCGQSAVTGPERVRPGG